jgi:hypothetical protein
LGPAPICALWMSPGFKSVDDTSPQLQKFVELVRRQG